MPSRKDGRVEPGQKISSALSARAWNRAQQAADRVLGAEPSLKANPGGSSLSYTPAMVRNLSGNDCDIGDVVVLDHQTQQPDYFDYKPGGAVLLHAHGNAVSYPTNCAAAIAVAVEPVKQAEIGRFAVDGVVLANVDTTGIDGQGLPENCPEYAASVDWLGVTSLRAKYLNFNSDGVLCPCEVGPAVLLSVPINEQGLHAAPESQPELCLIKLGQLPPAVVRIGRWNTGVWELGEKKILYDVDRDFPSDDLNSGGLRFRAWNNFRRLTNGPSLVCCALDLWNEWQVVSVAPNPDVDEVVVDVQVNQDGTVSQVVKKKLF